jgi:hypothetical protein
MSVLHPSSIRPFFTSRPRHHVFPNPSTFKRETALLPNDGMLPTAGIFTECFEENFLSNGVFLLNTTHKSISFLYQFLVLTICHAKGAATHPTQEIKQTPNFPRKGAATHPTQEIKQTPSFPRKRVKVA